MSLRRRRPGLVYPVNEDWHYVGDTGEPDWYDPGGGDAWENAQANFNLGFRIREAGIVDIQGLISATSDPPVNGIVVTLPVGYRPSSPVYMSGTGITTADKYVPATFVLDTAGVLEIADATIDPYPGAADALARMYISAQFFLTPPSAP